MAVNEINLKRATAPGGWVKPTEILVQRTSAQWATVRSAWVKRAAAPGGWVKVYEVDQSAPTTVSPGGTPTFSSAVVSWNSAPQATEYQVVQRPDLTGAAGSSVAYPWTANLSYTISALNQDTTYTFTVKARRPLHDGSYQESLESTSMIRLNTGHPAGPIHNPEWPNPKTGVLVSAAKSDTWTDDAKWAARSEGEVAQGYANYPSRDAYGCVRYHTIYNQLVTQFGKGAADAMTVLDVKIDLIKRKETGSGAGTPTITVYPALIDFASTRRPDNVYSPTTFNAPIVGGTRQNFNFADPVRLINWVQEWVGIKSGLGDLHNGLLIHGTSGGGNPTAGYNGFCVFRGANINPSDWRLILSVNWTYGQTTTQNPAWI